MEHAGRPAVLVHESDLFTVMSTCRAMRRLHPDPVSDELILELIRAANQAPSGRNLQRARWIVVRDADQKRRIAELNLRAADAMVDAAIEHPEDVPHHDRERRRRMWEAVRWQADHMHEAPVLIVACCIMDSPDQEVGRFASSIWPGIQNLLLAARALGLGATPTTFALGDELEAALDLPDRVRARAVIPVGHPVGRFGPVRRRPVEQVMMIDRWTGDLPPMP